MPRGEMFGPGSWNAGVRATLEGKMIGRRHGDPRTRPVMAVVLGDELTWRHIGAHAGGHPRLDDIPGSVRR